MDRVARGDDGGARDFFEGYARDFDHIYDEAGKGPIARYVERLHLDATMSAAHGAAPAADGRLGRTWGHGERGARQENGAAQRKDGQHPRKISRPSVAIAYPTRQVSLLSRKQQR